jgi:hypothetical protein
MTRHELLSLVGTIVGCLAAGTLVEWLFDPHPMAYLLLGAAWGLFGAHVAGFLDSDELEE